MEKEAAAAKDAEALGRWATLVVANLYRPRTPAGPGRRRKRRNAREHEATDALLRWCSVLGLTLSRRRPLESRLCCARSERIQV